MKALAITVMLLVGAHAAAAQKPAFTVDKKLAESGKKLFTEKGCVACHTIGKGQLVGPDLKGVTDRRSIAWLERWLHDPPAMVASDSIAKALRKDYPVEMPNLQLTPDEIRAVINYLAKK
jgi:mono/diheme cytochrome c family protein